MSKPLNELSSVESVENLFIFVADSVRKGEIKDDVSSLGVSGKAVAPSTFTASSFPSLVSGLYPSSHRVWDFHGQLPDQPELLSGPESFGMDASTIWTDLPPNRKPPFMMARATSDHARTLADLTPPFVSIVHHKGGHSPYGYSFGECESVKEFYHTHRPSLEELPELYRSSIDDAESEFLDHMAYLKQERLLEDTLVIYTSDHGELLGEAQNGMTIGHGHPMVPDLVHVPIVFAGAGLPDSELEGIVSGTDVAPTGLGALGRCRKNRYDGSNLWNSKQKVNRLCRSERWQRVDVPKLGEVDKYRATSVWDDDGGIVLHSTNRWKRILLTSGPMMFRYPESYLHRRPQNVRRWFGFLKTHFPSMVQYGNPNFSQETAEQELEPFRDQSFDSGAEIDEENLRKLGYID